MDFNDYAIDVLVRDRLDALRAGTTRRRLGLPRPPVTPLRVHAGRALARVGQWLLRAPAQSVPVPR